MWHLKDFIILLIGGGVIWLALGDDTRPESVQYIEDPRNDCKLVDKIPLANRRFHIRNDQYGYNTLFMYHCANNQKAAIIKEDE